MTDLNIFGLAVPLSLCEDLLTHREAMKLHSEEERGTYSAKRDIRANTCKKRNIQR